MEVSLQDLQLENTPLLLDAVNSGSIENVRYVLENNEYLDLNIELCYLKRRATVPIPEVDIDIIQHSRDVQPERILGCAVLQRNAAITAALLDYSDSVVLTHADAVICMYYSTNQVHRLVTDSFPETMVNRRLVLDGRGASRYMRMFFPLLTWCYTPIHVLLLSFYMHSEIGLHMSSSFMRQQRRKLRYIDSRGGVLDGETNYSWRTLGQLLIAGELKLAKAMLSCGVVNFSLPVCRRYLRQIIKLKKRNAFLFLTNERVCRPLSMKGPDAGHDIILSNEWTLTTSTRANERWTELILHNQFVFNGNHYTIRCMDTPSRVYNLFRAGVYIRDTFDYIDEMDQRNPLVHVVRDFVEKSRTPFRLDFLCRQVVKQAVGPKDHYRKLTELYNPQSNICVPKPIVRFLAVYKYTIKGKLRGDKWLCPLKWRNAPVLYRPEHF